MKTCILTFYDLGVGGIQTKLLSIANRLCEQGHTVILVIGQHVPHERTQQLHEKVVVVYPLKYFPWVFKKRYYLSLLWYSWWYRADSLLVSLEDTSAFVLRWAGVIPLWKTKIVVNYDLLPSAQQKLPTHILSQLLKKADSIVAVSKAVHRELTTSFHLSSTQVKYIPNWVDSALHTDVKSRREVKSFVFAGRLSPQKQPLVAVSVFESIYRHTPSVTLNIYGIGELWNVLHDKVEHSKARTHICMHQPRVDIASILRGSGFLLLTSKYEGLPFIAIEAMQCGCVVAALRFPGVEDLVEDGVTGILAKTPAELAKKVETYLSNPTRLERIRHNARRAQERFFGQQALHTFLDEL